MCASGAGGKLRSNDELSAAEQKRGDEFDVNEEILAGTGIDRSGRKRKASEVDAEEEEDGNTKDSDDGIGQ